MAQRFGGIVAVLGAFFLLGAAPGSGCVAGSTGVRLVCGVGEQECSGACVNITNDQNNCGRCYNMCNRSATCRAATAAAGQKPSTGSCSDGSGSLTNPDGTQLPTDNTTDDTTTTDNTDNGGGDTSTGNNQQVSGATNNGNGNTNNGNNNNNGGGGGGSPFAGFGGSATLGAPYGHNESPLFPVSGSSATECRAGAWATWAASPPAFAPCSGNWDVNPVSGRRFGADGMHRAEVRLISDPTKKQVIDFYVHASLDAGGVRCPAGLSDTAYFTAAVTAFGTTHMAAATPFTNTANQSFEMPYLNLSFVGVQPGVSMSQSGAFGTKYTTNFSFNNQFQFANGGFMAPLRHRVAVDLSGGANTGKTALLRRAWTSHDVPNTTDPTSCQLRFKFDGAIRTCDAYAMTNNGGGVCLNGNPITATFIDRSFGWSAPSDEMMFGAKTFNGNSGGRWTGAGAQIAIGAKGLAPQ